MYFGTSWGRRLSAQNSAVTRSGEVPTLLVTFGNAWLARVALLEVHGSKIEFMFRDNGCSFENWQC